MKFALLFVCLLAITSIRAFDVSDFEPMESAFEANNSIDTIETAYHCIVEGKNVVEELIQLSKNIVSDNVIGIIKDTYLIINNIFKILSDCQTLFCFEPTFEKCESYHSQGCEKTGLIVYPKCAEGYTNWECCVCANECPQDFRDDGLYCAKPGAYGRGAGYVIWDRKKCESQNPQGCEKNGLLWYPKCKPGYHNVGCCICSPDCPSGWTDIGVSCKKPDTYGRGVGYPVHFGLSCLKYYQEEQKLQSGEVDCEELKEKISILEELVQGKLIQEKINIQQQGFSDQIQLLNESVKQYINSCPIQEQQE